jgi:hypothetical protein
MKKQITIGCFMLLARAVVFGQMPLIDRGLQVEGLWCFPIYGDTLKYVYLPNEASLGKNADNTPQFSYMRYVMSTASTATESSIQEADGGAILNFLVLYNAKESSVLTAEKTLRKTTVSTFVDR